MILAIDEEKGPQLFKCDPAGHFFGHKVIFILWFLRLYNFVEISIPVSSSVSLMLIWSILLLQATSAGVKEQEAINFLEKKMKNDPAFSYDETVQVQNYSNYIGALELLQFKIY